MSNESLMRGYVLEKRILKNQMSVVKQYEEEIEKRFDNGTLVERKEKENG